MQTKTTYLIMPTDTTYKLHTVVIMQTKTTYLKMPTDIHANYIVIMQTKTTYIIMQTKTFKLALKITLQITILL